MIQGIVRLSLVAILCVGLAFGCSRGNASTAERTALEPPATSLKTVAIAPSSAERLGIKTAEASANAATTQLKVTGTLEYDLSRYAEIGALVEGRITDVRVALGDRVQRGQVLAYMVVPAIASAQADYLTAAAAASAAGKNAEREEALLERQLTTAREAEAAESEAAKSAAELAAASAKLRALHVGVPGSNAAVGSAGNHALTSPIDGIVVRREAVLGGFMEPNKVAFAVADLAELWANLEVYEADLSYVSVGADVEVSIDATPGRVFQGKVVVVDPQLGKSTRSARARVVVPNPDAILRPGMFVRAGIALPARPADGGLVLPSGTVQPLGGEDVVFVDRGGGKYEVRPVKVARRTAAMVEVTEGVTIGEPVVVDGAFLLRGEVTRQ